MIEANLIDTLITKKSTILFDKNKDAKFNFTDYYCLVEKLMYLL